MTDSNKARRVTGAAMEADDNAGRNPTNNRWIGDIVAARLSRRGLLAGAAATGAAVATGTSVFALLADEAKAASEANFDFSEVEHGVDETHHIADGYSADVLLRWGDPIFADAPDFDPYNPDPDAAEKQFGYNNDFLGLAPLPMGSDGAERALLCVNHEYTEEPLVFPESALAEAFTVGENTYHVDQKLAEVEMAMHGGSIVEIAKTDGKWAVVRDSEYNRRITPRSTEMAITGPAAGHARMQTSADPSGAKVVGTLNNCAGGMTPWGTYLMAEENFHGYFYGELAGDHPEKANYERYGVPGAWYAWGKFFDRFEVSKEPNEANRFGWVVEVDPYDPTSTPKKRTALGRFKHEGAESVVNKDGRVVVHMGDDERFEYLYKFVSAGTYNPDDRAANMDLLDDGVLYVAKFDDDGGVEWMALTHGEGPLTAENGFESQADVMIETRRAADLLGATKMDRPEDAQANPKTGRAYVMLTNNSKRAADQVDGPNPRAENSFGQVLEITSPDGDFAATKENWDLLVVCGDPAKADVGARWNPATSENGWFASPDNCAVDHAGRLWITTDQGSSWAKSGTADGVFALETDGELRGTGKMFFRVPLGAEMCGPCFSADDSTLFVAVQHPAADGVDKYEAFGRESTFDDPATRWPDFDDKTPPRPSVMMITKNGGGRIGG